MLTDQSGRIPGLDGLRAVSLLLVLSVHMSYSKHFLSKSMIHWLEYCDLGDLGVRVFFVISGFLITTLLLREGKKYGSISLGHFYTRRCFRILPPCYFYIAVIGLIVFFGGLALEAKEFLYAVTYTMNYSREHGWQMGHLWSLAVEEQFYFIWPAVMAFSGPKRSMYFAFAVICIVPWIRFTYLVLHIYPAGQIITKPFEACCDGLAVGCLLAGIRGWLGSQKLYQDYLHSALPYTLPVGILFCNSLFQWPRIHLVVGIPLENILIALLIDWVVRMPETMAGRFLELRFIRRIGVLSYSIYLWQQLFCTQFRFGDTWWGQFPMNLLFSIICGWLSYVLVERPALRLRDLVEKRFPQRQPVALTTSIS